MAPQATKFEKKFWNFFSQKFIPVYVRSHGDKSFHKKRKNNKKFWKLVKSAKIDDFLDFFENFSIFFENVRSDKPTKLGMVNWENGLLDPQSNGKPSRESSELTYPRVWVHLGILAVVGNPISQFFSILENLPHTF